MIYKLQIEFMYIYCLLIDGEEVHVGGKYW